MKAARHFRPRILTLRQLAKAGACAAQHVVFERRFGSSVEVTPELCDSVADVFDWGWAAVNLLSPDAYAAYKRVRAQASAEFNRATAPTLAEYRRVTALASAEHERVMEQALAEHERATAQAWAAYKRATARAFAEAFCSDVEGAA